VYVSKREVIKELEILEWGSWNTLLLWPNNELSWDNDTSHALLAVSHAYTRPHIPSPMQTVSVLFKPNEHISCFPNIQFYCKKNCYGSLMKKIIIIC